MPKVLVVGNLSEGFKIYGPFKDYEEAFDSAESGLSNSWVMTLHKPADDSSSRKKKED